jgi:hypothetical protein
MSEIDPLPPPPDPSDSRSVFNSKAFAFWGAMPAFQTQANSLRGDVNTWRTEAATSASTATTQAAEAAASELASASNAAAAAAAMGAIDWVSGTTYAIGDKRRSPADGRVYERRTEGAGTTDPSADSTNWAPFGPNGLQMAIVTGTSATVGANTDTAFTNPAQCAATVPAIAVGAQIVVRFDNGRLDNTVDIGARSMVGPNGVVVSGVITLNAMPFMALRWWGDYYRSN